MTVIRRTPLHTATVVATRDLTPRMRRITLQVPTLDAPRPAQDIEVVLTDDTGRKVKRRYTITNYRDGRFDVDALRHGEAPGARWAATAATGDEIQFFGPRGRLELRDAAWHLFVGDESALPAIVALAAAVDAPAYALIEIGDASDELPVDAEVRWLHRGDAPAGGSDLLGAALDAFPAPPGDGHGYLLGESRAVAALRPRLHALGLANDQLYVKGYWNLGRLDVRSRTSA
ncbi:MAG TPA: siderophore-interacting protein [Jatrophihabitantaceae bacterium]|jgi:NADPH-dependent ferric siderophore reductase